MQCINDIWIGLGEMGPLGETIRHLCCHACVSALVGHSLALGCWGIDPDPDPDPELCARPWKCEATCKSVGPTPPCGELTSAIGTGKTQQSAAKNARDAACQAINRHGGRCHPKHGTVKRCWQ